MANQCSIEGCMKPIKAKHLCAMHHQRLLRYGDPQHERVKAKEINCKWRRCEQPSVAKGYCQTHYLASRYLDKIGMAHIQTNMATHNH